MPIYEYRCPKCERTFEAFLPLSQASAPLRCDSCGFEKVEKLISAPSRASVRSASSGGIVSSAGAGPSCGSGGFS